MRAVEHEVIVEACGTHGSSGGAAHRRVQSGGRVGAVKDVARNRHADV
jgi:hypothetical protein